MLESKFSSRRNASPMSAMNMIPLIDVMLVLLVIFIVTAPLMGQAMKIDLPQANASGDIQVPAKIAVSIRADGSRLIDGKAVSREESRLIFMTAAQKKTMPEVHIYADQHADYQSVAQALSDAGQSGLTRIGFVTQPEK